MIRSPLTFGRRTWLTLVMALLVLTTAVSLGQAPATDDVGAQEATPVVPEGIAVEYLSNGIPASIDAATLEIVRLTVLPGATATDIERFGAATIFVSHGTIEFTVGEGEAIVLETDPGGITPRESPTTCDPICELVPGDSLVFTDDSVVSFTNNRTEPVVMLVSSLTPEGTGFTLFGCDRAC